MTGWRGEQVLYFGDHPYSDLADVTLEHGWRTGAIIHELLVSCNTCCIVLTFLIEHIELRWQRKEFWKTSYS
jgi:hypothetical protein